ncbi:MAG: four helix bundle protein [Flavobacteriales bacterium]|nr:four helix bundle protein [Flavobacteriales bacterium]
MRDYKELKIWQKGMEVVTATYDLVNELPDVERFGLRSQCSRAAVSIPSNIAEGSARKSTAHFLQYLETALGSTYELETQTIIIQQRFKLPIELTDKLLTLLDEEKKMLGSFMAKLRTRTP